MEANIFILQPEEWKAPRPGFREASFLAEAFIHRECPQPISFGRQEPRAQTGADIMSDPDTDPTL